jgi:hypothetical protein
MSYDSWKTRSDMDDAAWRNARDDELVSQCDCCGKMKAGCVDMTIGGRFPIDVHACPECRGDEED